MTTTSRTRGSPALRGDFIGAVRRAVRADEDFQPVRRIIQREEIIEPRGDVLFLVEDAQENGDRGPFARVGRRRDTARRDEREQQREQDIGINQRAAANQKEKQEAITLVFPCSRTTRAGMPTAVAPSGKSCVTTAFAPTFNLVADARRTEDFRARAEEHIVAQHGRGAFFGADGDLMFDRGHAASAAHTGVDDDALAVDEHEFRPGSPRRAR